MGFLNSLAPQAHWLLRIALASVFLYHGLPKFANLSGIAQMMGMPVFMLLLVALAEVGGSMLILLGGFMKDWMTRIGAFLQVPVMLGAIFMVHLPQGWNFMNVAIMGPAMEQVVAAAEAGKGMVHVTAPGGAEFQVTLLLIQLYLVIKGNAVKAETAGASPAV